LFDGVPGLAAENFIGARLAEGAALTARAARCCDGNDMNHRGDHLVTGNRQNTSANHLWEQPMLAKHLSGSANTAPYGARRRDIGSDDRRTPAGRDVAERGWRKREQAIEKAVAALAKLDDQTLRDFGIPHRSYIEQTVRYCHDC